MRAIFACIATAVAGFLVCLFAWSFLPDNTPKAGIALPQGSAVFETSLASRISPTDTAMTLVSVALRGSASLSGYNCFTVDEGRSDQEFICGSVSGTTVSSLERGLSFSNGSTTVAALEFAHRTGANVKITDFPLIQRMRNQLNGGETFPNVLSYASNPTFTVGQFQLVTWDKAKAYTDSVSFNGAANADTVTNGLVQIATQLQAASSTAIGNTGAILAYGNGMATDTPNTATRASRILMSDMLGYLKQGWLNLSEAWTFTSNVTFSGGATTTATTTIAASSLLGAPFKINGLTYKYPSVRGASSTVLTENGSGSLIWMKPTAGQYTFSTTNDSTAIAGGYASTTLMTIPAGVMTASSTITVDAEMLCAVASGANPCTLYLRNSTGQTFSSASGGGTMGDDDCIERFLITSSSNSVSSQKGQIQQLCSVSGIDAGDMSSSMNLAAQTTFVLVVQSPDSDTIGTIGNAVITVIP